MVKYINFIQTVFPVPVWDPLVFHLLQYIKMNASLKLLNITTTTWEGIVALDDDMIIHVAPASAGAPVPELTRAFIVPKGTMVKINTAIWHLCLFL